MNVMRHRGAWLTASLAVGLALAIAIAASARGASSASPLESGTAAGAIGALKRPQVASDHVPAAGQGFINAQKPSGVPESQFEGAWQLGRSRRLVAGAGASGASVFAVPTDKGRVCSVIVVPPSAAAGGCVDAFSSTMPAGWTVFDPDELDAGRAVIVAGVVPDGVTSVGVAVDGTVANASVTQNAFVYQLSSATSYPSAIVVSYVDGTSRTIEVQDPRPVMRACASGTC